MLKLRIESPSCIKQDYKIISLLRKKSPNYSEQSHKIILKLYIKLLFVLNKAIELYQN